MRRRKLFGLKLKPGSGFVFDGLTRNIVVHLLNASLAPDAEHGSRATLLSRINGKDHVVGILQSPKSSFMRLDLAVAESAVLAVKGNADVHLVGLEMECISVGDEYFRDELMLQQIEGGEVAAKKFEAQEIQGDDSDARKVDSESEAKIPPPSNPIYVVDLTDSPRQGAGNRDTGGVLKPPLGAKEDTMLAGAFEERKGAEPKVDNQEVKSPKRVKSEKEENRGQSAGTLDHLETPSEPKESSKKQKAKKGRGKKRGAEVMVADDQPSTDPTKPKKNKKKGNDGVAPSEASNPEKKSKKKSKKEARKKRKASKAEGGEKEAGGSSSVAGLKAGSTDRVLRFENGMIIERLECRDDVAKAEVGSKIEIKYKGFDMSTGSVVDHGQMKMVVGSGEVIKGLDEGVKLMGVGEKRILTLPPQMGYGEEGVKGRVSRNATLKFHVQLVRLHH